MEVKHDMDAPAAGNNKLCARVCNTTQDYNKLFYAGQTEY